MQNKLVKISALIIIAVAAALAIASAWNDSIVVDEVPHIGAGYSYLVKQDMRLNPEHPPLAKDLAAIPLLFLHLKQNVFNSKFWLQDLNGQWEFGRQLIFNSGNDADQIKHYARLPLILLFILSAIFVFKWGRKLYGDIGAIGALILFAFSPTILTHSRFVTTDMAALFGVLSATYFFVGYLKNRAKTNFILASLFFGIALLCKFSTFLLVPFFLLLALVHGFTGKMRDENKTFAHKLAFTGKTVFSTIVIMLIGFVVILWPVYYLHTRNEPPQKQHSDTQMLLSTYGNRAFADPVVWASDKPVLRAAAQYGLGLLMVNQRVIGGNTTYFLGEVSRFGWRKYFPIVYFIKEPLAWWILVAIALLYVGWQTGKPSKESAARGISFIKKYPDEFAMILWLFIYWGISMEGTLNIGVRHLLPTYPFAILLVSGQITRIIKALKMRGQKAIAGLALMVGVPLGWYIYENLRVYPFYLTYFNQVVGGPAGGYKYVVDSNLDWGQDLIRFSDWVKSNNIPRIEFNYFGWADPYYYLGSRYIWTSATKYKDAEDFKARNQSDGWLAISATFLMGSQGPADMPNKTNYLWLNSYQPLTVIGNSIFVYRIK